MIKIIFLAFTFVVFNHCLIGQSTTIILQPSEYDSKDALLSSLQKSKNRGDYPDLASMSWTVGGAPVDYRSLIEFDLSSIPIGSVIDSARLSLYSYHSSGLGTHSTRSGSNESVISRIISPWEEISVTWDNQPTYTTHNQVFLPESSDSIQDYLNIDVTNLIQDIVSEPNNNFGFLLKLVNEQHYRAMVFAASGHSNSNLHPRLEVTFTEATDHGDSCLILKPSGEEGKDALISSLDPSENYAEHPDFTSLSWTNSGDLVDFRSLIDFDLSSIPNGAAVEYAKLSLYSYNSPSNGSHSTKSGSNESVLSRVTSSWDENTVNWNNQPNSVAENQIYLPSSSNSIQDYLDIDVTNLIEDMISEDTSYGFLLKLVTEQSYRSMLFASSDNSDATLHPKLEICYSYITSKFENTETKKRFSLFPNPTENSVAIDINSPNQENIKIDIINSMGSLIYQKLDAKLLTKIDLSNYSKGLYFVKVYFEGNVSLEKLIVK